MIKRNNQKSAAQKVADFFQNNWKFVAMCVVLIILMPWIIKYFKTMFYSIEKQEEEEQKDRLFRENKNPGTLNAKMDEYLDSKDTISTSTTTIKNAARNLAHALGTLYSDTDSWYSWADPRGWFENDRDVRNLLAATKYDFQHVAECYYYVTRSRDLSADLVKLLDKNEVDYLRENGYNWF